MSRLDGFRHRLAVLLRRRAYAREVEEEIRFHLELEAMHRRGDGAAAAEARLAARRQFGNEAYFAEEVRRMTGFEWLDTVARDARYAVRTLRRSPAFTIVALLTFALGIGATAAVFTVVNAVLLKPLPFPQSDRLLGLWHTAPGLGIEQFEQSDGTYFLYRRENRSFESMGLYQTGAVNAGTDAEPERIAAAWITASLLPTLRVAPLRGRDFTEADDRPGAPQVALISESLWRRKFGADPGAVGRTMQVNGVAREIVGVLPMWVRFPEASTQLWLPLGLDPARVSAQTAFSFNYDAVGRLKPGVTIDAARRDLERLFVQVPDRYPGFLDRNGMAKTRAHVIVHPLRDDVVGSVGPVLWVVLGTAGLVLLIGCANVANLFLVRAEARQREMAVRTAVGARRADLLRHTLVESLALALAGGALGLALAMLGVRWLVRLGPAALPRLDEIAVDGRVLAVTLAVSVAAGLLFSALPALRYGAMQLGVELRGGGRGATLGRERQRARQVLAVTQVALALVLLAASALMARSFARLRAVDPGFDPTHVLTLRLSLPDALYRGDTARVRFFDQLLQRARALPGVRDVALSHKLPLLADGNNNSAVFVEDVPVPPGTIPPVHELSQVSEGYFRAMGIPLVAGRDFAEGMHVRGALEAVVSRSLAEHYWKGRSPLGRRLRPGPLGPWYSIVGVVGDVHDAGLEQPAQEFVYFPMAPLPGDTILGVEGTMSLVVRTGGDPRGAEAGVRAVVRELDAGLPIFNLRSMTTVVRGAMARTSFTLVLLSIASTVALLLGAVGIYGVISYLVSLRSREIGLRMALGAQGAAVRWMFARQGIALALAGVGVGLVGALLLTRLLRTLLFGVGPGDPAALLAAAAVLVAVAAAASAIPAWRASRADPMQVLRAE